ncbi:hypothetical protein [Sebaldella sp. S0638]|nr:hypothetical protein [Sebaldella sp. S0638]
MFPFCLTITKLDGESNLYDYYGNLMRTDVYKDGTIQSARFFEIN